MNQQENYLARAEQLIIEQELCITRQTMLIQRLAQKGYATREAEQHLKTLEDFLIEIYEYRKKILNRRKSNRHKNASYGAGA